MPAPKGNVYYQLAKRFVKPKSYHPEDLWIKAIDCFDWNDNNPLKEQKVFGNGLICTKPITAHQKRMISVCKRESAELDMIIHALARCVYCLYF